MSFGFGIGDIMAISGLALKVHTAYKDAPDDYRNIADEVRSLHIIINEAARHFESTTLSNKEQQGGKEVLEGCQHVLKDLDALIEKYHALASANRSQVFERIKLGTEDIATLRARLTSNTTLLNSFIQGLDITTVIIEYIMLISRRSCKLDEMQAQLNIVLGPRRSSSLISFAGSINTKKVYKNFCKGLFESGVTAEMIKSKEEEIHNLFQPPNATTSSQIDVNTNTDQSQLLEGESNQNWLRFRPPVDFLVGPLMLDAAEAGNIKRLQSTLGYVRNINFLDDTGSTALHKAASGGYNDIVQLLLIKGASIEAVDKYYNTPLHRAAMFGHTSTVGLLLSKGASIEPTDKDNDTPSHIAALYGHTSTVELLLSKGASIEATDYYNDTPLHFAAMSGHTSTVGLLLSKGASIEATDKDNDTPLHLAALLGRTSTVELLLSKGASIDAADKDNYTPLHLAAKHDRTDTVGLLLSKGASIEATNKYNYTPLHIAARNSHTSTVELLLSKGASIEATNKDNDTPLHLARLYGGNTRVVKLLERAKVTNS